jgi:ubiquinone biosynthesis protein
MLEVGRERAAAKRETRVDFAEVNAEELPFPGQSFDGYTIAFGIRNVPRIEVALAEAHRVLRSGSRFLCLEFSRVDVPGLDRVYDAYSFGVIPRLGAMVAGDRESYQYLVESIRRFPPPPAFGRMIEGAGFRRVTHRVLTGGSWRSIRAGRFSVRRRSRASGPQPPGGLRPGARGRAWLGRCERAAAGRADAAADGPAGRETARSPRAGPVLDGADPARAVLRQNRPVPGNPARHRGTVVARDLESLQDRMASFSQAEAIALVETATGRPLGQTFSSFGAPVAAASIAQVHRASRVPLPGEDMAADVAVKIVRPGIRELFARDLQAMRFAARMAERYLAEARRLKPTEIVETLARSVAMETDLRLEAAALSELAENTADDPAFRVPRPDWDLTGRDVLTSEWVDGIPLSRLDAIEAAGHDRPALARTVLQSFLQQAIRDGFFHADMHPGNLMVDPQGRLVAVDTGIMGRLGLKERRFLAEILLGFIRRDYRRVAEVHFEAGYVPAHHNVDDFAQAIRAIGEPIHNRRADEISMASLLTLLFEITAIFEMATRPELVMLQKTMVVVEGVARSLDPKLDIWAASEPVVRTWIERNLGPVGVIEDAGRSLSALLGVASRLPDILMRVERVLANVETVTGRGIPLEPATIGGIARHTTSALRWVAVAAWLIVAMLVVGALVAT